MKKIIVFSFLFIAVNASSQVPFRLMPDSAWLRLNNTLTLRIAHINGDFDHLSWLKQGVYFFFSYPEVTVNGVVNGNDLTGRITTIDNDFPYDLIFKAPLKKPLKNPVEVITSYRYAAFLSNLNSPDKEVSIREFDTTFTSYIEIVDKTDSSAEKNAGSKNTNEKKKDNTKELPGEKYSDSIRLFEVKMISKQQGANFSYIDSGSFVVFQKGKTARLIGIDNKNSTDKLEFVAAGCTSKLINPGANHGHIHITGVKEIKVTPAGPPNYPLVEITFIEAPMVYSTFKITCIVRGKTVISTTEQANAIVAKSYALPLSIKFLSKEGDQVIEDRKVSGGYYKVTVKQLKID